MPPRSKQSKTDLVTCSDCGIVFSSRDQSCHNDICQQSRSEINFNSFPHGFIKGDTLYAFLTKTNDGKSDGNKENTPCGVDVIYCNPGSMKLCGMYIGGRVVVCKSVVCQVWPNHSLPLTGVAMCPQVHSSISETLKLKSHITVNMLPRPSMEASEVTLTLREPKSYMGTKEFKEFFKRHYEKKFLKASDKLVFDYYGQPCEISVSDVQGSAITRKQNSSQTVAHLANDINNLTLKTSIKAKPTFYEVTERTQILVLEAETSNRNGKYSITLDDIGGLSVQVDSLKELIDLQLRRPKHLKTKCTGLPKGILLYGPSGTGKTLLARAICHWSQVHVVSVTASSIWSKYYGETEKKISEIFSEAKDRAPAIVFIDEIDTLCGRRQNSNNEIEKRVVSSLLTSIDTLLESSQPVMVLAATSRPDDLDLALRRPGRLDREIELGVPTVAERFQILKKLMEKFNHSVTEEVIQQIASNSHGYVGADLAALCHEGAVHAAKRCRDTEVILNTADLVYGLQNIKPSAMREVALEVPQVSWSDIGGQSELKHKLQQAIEWPLKHPEAFQRLGIRPPRGLLMYGPPGCSKTMIAKALAHDSGINFIAIKGPELFSKWVGESERAVREVFRKARAAAPAIVFFDEIDALAGERGGGGGGGGEVTDRVLAQLLTEIDGVDALKDVTIVAATNRPDRIDKALLRPGRLDRIVYVPLPDDNTRLEIFKIQVHKMPVADDVTIDQLVAATVGYSGAEVAAVCHEAALAAMQEDIDITCVHYRHFEQALKIVTPRINKELLNFYEDFHTSLS